MSTSSINSNIAALIAQRRLNEATNSLQRSYERLSSGLRINHASDDSAGQAIASSLSASSRVFTQGVRNTNDGISLLNVAEGATQQLSDILVRMKELAEGAANGTLSLTQRRSSDTEAHQLQQEFNRIVLSTKFNGRGLLDGTLGALGIQGGFGARGALTFNVGNAYVHQVGDGTATTTQTYTNIALEAVGLMDSADVNGDGKMDLVIADTTSTGAAVLLSNGDGTFKSQALGAHGIISAHFADANNDGKMDAVLGGLVYLGNGNGTFRTASGFGSAGFGVYSRVADVNGDNILDYIDRQTGQIDVYLGNGDGSFKSAKSSSASGDQEVVVGDFDGDGRIDLASARGDGTVDILSGAGNGTFALSKSVSAGATLLEAADLNHDGLTDLIGKDNGSVLVSNGNGTFKTSTLSDTFSYGQISDLNGDGNPDFIGVNALQITQYFGNGDGTFRLVSSTDTSSNGEIAAFGDFDGNGSTDVTLTNSSSTQYDTNFFGTTSSNVIQRLDLLSASNARSALTTIDSLLQLVNNDLSALGSAQSRLQTMGNLLGATSLNYDAAKSRITDIDVAQESASLTAQQIRQQAASAVLAQANQAPAIALSLLRF